MISALKAGLVLFSLPFLVVIADMFVLCYALQRKSEDRGFQLGRERIRRQFRPSEEPSIQMRAVITTSSLYSPAAVDIRTPDCERLPQK
jgi:hypothetical protein